MKKLSLKTQITNLRLPVLMYFFASLILNKTGQNRKIEKEILLRSSRESKIFQLLATVINFVMLHVQSATHLMSKTFQFGCTFHY